MCLSATGTRSSSLVRDAGAYCADRRHSRGSAATQCSDVGYVAEQVDVVENQIPAVKTVFTSIRDDITDAPSNDVTVATHVGWRGSEQESPPTTVNADNLWIWFDRRWLGHDGSVAGIVLLCHGSSVEPCVLSQANWVADG